MKTIHNTKRRRAAFTLLELLIVISIIALLMSLSVVVLLGVLNQAEEEATSATIQKVNRLLEQRVEAFDRSFKGARRTTAMQMMRSLLADPNSDGNTNDGIFGVTDAVVEILAKKALFRHEFPQRIADRTAFGVFSEGTFSDTGVPNSIYMTVCAPIARQELGLADTFALTDTAIKNKVKAKFSTHAAETESSELLYYFLLKSGSYGASSVDTDRFSGAEIQDTDEDGLPEFVDAWGNPLRFYRWPTRLIDTNPAVPFQPVLANLADATDTPPRVISQLERDVANLILKGLPPAPTSLPNGALPRDLLLTDPDDPIGRIYTELERLDGTNGKPLFNSHFNEASYHTPDTFHAPLVISAGPDERLGLFEPNDTARAGNLGAYDSDLDGNGTAGEPSDFDLLLDALTDNLTSRNKISGGR
jgi:prepilin-type N-terminal cleavage/methylation domain-containing protein